MHPWDVSPKEAIAIQKSLQSHIQLEDDFGDILTVAGVDVGFEKTIRLRVRRSLFWISKHWKFSKRQWPIGRRPFLTFRDCSRFGKFQLYWKPC
jgi:hypothetical protein